jgi:site-specific DNA-cytosine methylase
MPVTVTDLFCGAGGSSLGAEAVANVEVVMAANQGFR